MNEYLSKKIKIISLYSIVLVVYIHAYNLKDRFLLPTTKISEGLNINSFFQYFISNGFARTGVPLFFAISGYLFYRSFEPSLKGYLNKLSRRAYTLLLPYVIWSALGMVLLFVVQLVPYIASTYNQELVRNYSFGKLLGRLFLSPVSFQLWFINDLIKYVILTPVIYFIVKKGSYFSMLIFYLVWFMDINLPFINNEGIFFYILGSFLALKSIDMCRAMRKSKLMAISFTWIVLLCIKTYLASSGGFILLYLHKASIVAGVISVWYMYDFIAAKNKYQITLLKYSTFTFFIFAGHEPLLNILTGIFVSFTGKSNLALMLIYILNPVLVILILTTVAALIRKSAGGFYKILTGGREA